MSLGLERLTLPTGRGTRRMRRTTPVWTTIPDDAATPWAAPARHVFPDGKAGPDSGSAGRRSRRPWPTRVKRDESGSSDAAFAALLRGGTLPPDGEGTLGAIMACPHAGGAAQLLASVSDVRALAGTYQALLAEATARGSAAAAARGKPTYAAAAARTRSVGATEEEGAEDVGAGVGFFDASSMAPVPPALRTLRRNQGTTTPTSGAAALRWSFDHLPGEAVMVDTRLPSSAVAADGAVMLAVDHRGRDGAAVSATASADAAADNRATGADDQLSADLVHALRDQA